MLGSEQLLQFSWIRELTHEDLGVLGRVEHMAITSDSHEESVTQLWT